MFDNKLNDNWNNYFDMSFDFRVASEQINTDITGLHRIDYMISTEQDGGISNPKLLIFVDKFKSWYEQQPQIANITALSDTFKRLNKSMNGDVEDGINYQQTLI